jgi:hypothetical protein
MLSCSLAVTSGAKQRSPPAADPRPAPGRAKSNVTGQGEKDRKRTATPAVTGVSRPRPRIARPDPVAPPSRVAVVRPQPGSPFSSPRPPSASSSSPAPAFPVPPRVRHATPRLGSSPSTSTPATTLTADRSTTTSSQPRARAPLSPRTQHAMPADCSTQFPTR